MVRRPAVPPPTRLRVGALLAGFAAVLLVGACAGHPARLMQRHVYEHPSARGGAARGYDCYVGLPEGYDDPARAGQRWPLLLYLPGMLTYGRNVAKPLRGGPTDEIERGRKLPMIVLMPTTPTFFEPWTPDLVLGVIDHACATWRIDPDRIYVAGDSLGGAGAWDIAQAHPERVAALVTVAAWGDPWGIERMVDVPVWSFHGALDFAVLPPFHERMVCALNAAGGRGRFTRIPWGFHWIWDGVYARDDLYAWMLAQHKRRGAVRGSD